MRTFTIAAVVLAVLAAPAHAQGRRPHAEEKKADQILSQVAETIANKKAQPAKGKAA